MLFPELWSRLGKGKGSKVKGVSGSDMWRDRKGTGVEPWTAGGEGTPPFPPPFPHYGTRYVTTCLQRYPTYSRTRDLAFCIYHPPSSSVSPFSPSCLSHTLSDCLCRRRYPALPREPGNSPSFGPHTPFHPITPSLPPTFLHPPHPPPPPPSATSCSVCDVTGYHTTCRRFIRIAFSHLVEFSDSLTPGNPQEFASFSVFVSRSRIKEIGY